MVTSEAWLDAQVTVLGSVLLAPSECAEKVISRTSNEDYSDTYRPIYQAICHKYAAGEAIDPVTIRVMLGEKSREVIFHIMDETPTAAHCDEYIEILKKQSILIRSRALGEQLSQAEDMEVVEKVQSQLADITVSKQNVRVVYLAEALHDFFERQRGPKPDYLRWGLEPLDKQLHIGRGDFVILGGYPSDGKTTLALSMALEQAKTKRVAFFSFETSDAKLADRIVAMQARVDFGRIKRQEMTEDELDAAASASTQLAPLPLALIPAAGMSVEDIQTKATSRRFEVVYVDYAQLIRPKNPRQTITDQMTEVSKDLHKMAQSTGITVVALCQLSRPEIKSETVARAPNMHSVKNSSQFEQDADAILLLYREFLNRPDSQRMFKISKNKEGEVGVPYKLMFDGATQTFRLDRNDKSVWRKQPSQVSMRELSEDTPVPF